MKVKTRLWLTALFFTLLFYTALIFAQPYFPEHSYDGVTLTEVQFVHETESLLQFIEGNYIFFGSLETNNFAKSWYSYLAIQGYSTPEGWSPQVIDNEYWEDFREYRMSFRDRETEKFIEQVKPFNVTTIIAVQHPSKHCGYMEQNPEYFRFISGTPNVCLFTINWDEL